MTLFYNHIPTSTLGTNQLLDCIEIDLKNTDSGHLHTMYIDVVDSSLSRKWLAALNHLIDNKYHLEKNYCFFGFDKVPEMLNIYAIKSMPALLLLIKPI